MATEVNNIYVDPLFCNMDEGGFTLFDNSPCIGTGQDGANIGAFGIGCYAPIHSGPIWYVSTNGSDNNNGSEDNPFATIQHGINAASDGDTVFVLAGTYIENINYNGKNIVVQGEDREITIIDGNQNGSVVQLVNGENNTSQLNNFTITGGSTLNTSSAGGIHCYNSSPILSNLIIYNNEGLNAGGVMVNGGAAPLLKNSLLYQNTSNWGGGLAA